MSHLRIKARKEKFLSPPNGLQCQCGVATFANAWTAPVSSRAFGSRISSKSDIRRVPVLHSLVLRGGRFLSQPYAFDSPKEILGFLNHLKMQRQTERARYEMQQLQSRNEST